MTRPITDPKNNGYCAEVDCREVGCSCTLRIPKTHDQVMNAIDNKIRQEYDKTHKYFNHNVYNAFAYGYLLSMAARWKMEREGGAK